MAQLLPQLKKKKEWAKQTAQSLQSSSKNAFFASRLSSDTVAQEYR